MTKTYEFPVPLRDPPNIAGWLARTLPVRLSMPGAFNIDRALDEIAEKLGVERGPVPRSHMLLQSPGGSVILSFKVAKLLREAVSDLWCYISHFAMSGGRLIALAIGIMTARERNRRSLPVERAVQGC